MDTQQNTAGFRQNGRNFKLIRFLITVFAICLLLPVVSAIMSTYVFAAPIEIDITNFPDAVFRAYVSENFDVNPADNMLSEDEMNSVESIQLEPGACASLQGIEFFPNLRVLNCADNQLTELDLSNNPRLTSVNVGNNRLTSLNVNGNLSLGWLSAPNNHLLYVENLLSSTAVELYGQTVEMSVNADPENPDSCVSDNAYRFDGVPNILFSYSSVSYDSMTGRFMVPSWWLEYPIEFWTSVNQMGTLSGTITFNEVSIEINEINFPDPVFREYVRGPIIDPNGDGRLSSSEVNSVLLIEIPSGSGCASLQGIEFFPRLEWVMCEGNQLTSLNLSGNPALYWLVLNDNQLTSLDVSDNPALEWLYCANNQLTSLDVSDNPALMYLYCYDNQLTSLDVSGSFALTTLNATNNHLLYVEGLMSDTYADLSGQTVSITVHVDPENFGYYMSDSTYPFDGTLSIWLYDSNASYDLATGRFMVFDGSLEYPIEFRTYESNMYMRTTGTVAFNESSVEINETNFPDPVFREYVRGPLIDLNGDGRLSSSEINYVWSIDIPGGSGCASLQGIEFFPRLEWVTCEGNQLTSLDLSDNPALTFLDLNNNQLTSLNVSNNPTLAWLYCANNQLTSLDLSGNPELAYLDCTNNQLTFLDVSNNSSLAWLDAPTNHLLYIEGLSDGTSASLYGQTVFIPVNADPENPDSYVSDNAYLFNAPLGIEFYYSDASYNLATGRFMVPVWWLGYSINFYTYGNNMNTLITGTIIFDEPSVEINETNFPDPVFRSYVSEPFIDPNGDGRLSPSEANSVWSINIPDGSGCASLQGIEFFPRLEWVSCRDNQLSSLDLSGNPALTFLDLSDNQLTSLDVSGNPELTRLECANNQLTSLNVSNNPVLTNLVCINNHLSSLDLSGAPELTWLDLNNNQLTSLDVSSNLALTMLDAANNQLLYVEGLKSNIPAALSGQAVTVLVHRNPEPGYGNYFLSNNTYSFGTSEIYVYSLNAHYYTAANAWYPAAAERFEVHYAGLDIPIEFDTTMHDIYGLPSRTYGTITFIEVAQDGIPIDDAHFPDRIFQDYVRATFDLDNDYWLSPSEAEAATEIDFHGDYSCQSLEGIEYFPELTRLTLSHTALTDLALTDNPKLKEFSSEWDWSLISVDVTGNPELEKLSISEVFNLASLDVTGNPKLTELICRSGKLASLDVSSNPKLTKLECYANSLTFLDVSKNPALSVLDLGLNALASLDVSKNPALRELYCYYNYNGFLPTLSMIDVSNNPLLTTLHCYGNALTSLDVSKNPSLVELECYENNIASLDVSENPLLTRLHCRNNQFLTIDVSKNPLLTWLSVSYNNLTVLDVNSNLQLSSLFCYGNSLTTLDVSNNPLLIWLQCHDNQLLDVTGLASGVTNVSMESQTITIPVSADPDNPGSYLSAAVYPLGTHTIAFDGGAASHNAVTGRFTTTEINTPIRFATSIDGLYEVSGTIVFEGEPSPTTYTVTFVDWDDALIATRTVTEGASAIAPTSPERQGYTFTGWDRPFTNVAADLTVKATYEPLPTYTVTFAPGEHGAFAATSTPGLYAGDATPQAPQPVGESGWRFVGWLPLIDITVTGDVTYTAQWARIIYVVTFVDFDDTPLGAPQTVNEGDDAVAPAPPVRAGYTFTGWDTDFTNVTSNLTVRATYAPLPTYTVTFAPGEHGTFAATSTPGLYAGDVTPQAPQPDAESGWRFVGWLPELAPSVTGNATYTAQWEPVVVPPTTYTVTFVDFDDTPLGAPQSVFEGDDAVAPAPPTRPGYIFTGWDKAFTNITSDLTVKALYTPIPTYSVTFGYGTHALFPILEVIDFIPEGSATPAAPHPAGQPGWRFVEWLPALAPYVTADATYTAQWERITHTVTFVDFDDRILVARTVAYGADATAPTPPTRTGYTFTGWDRPFTNVTSNLTVKALYEPISVISTYTVTFAPGDHGLFATFISPGLFAGDATPTSPQTNAESGWRFVGWLPALAPTVTGDVTYIAQWEEVSHTVTFIDHDGTVLIVRTVSDGASALAPVPPVRPGYTFIGWDTSFVGVTSNITITALYEPVPTYTVSFAPGEHGAFVAIETSGLSAGDITPQAPQPNAESNWRFVGWLPAISSLVTGDVTYIAQWELIPIPGTTCTVVFDPGTHGTFAAQITAGLSVGEATPTAPPAAGEATWYFTGWLPELVPTVTSDVTYVAQWAQEVPPQAVYPAPSTPSVSTPPVEPPRVIVNGPSAGTTPPDQYITVPVPSASTGTGQNQSSTTGTGSSGNTDTTGAQDQDQTVSDDQTPLDDGTADAPNTNVLLFVLALVFLACLFGAGCLFMMRSKR